MNKCLICLEGPQEGQVDGVVDLIQLCTDADHVVCRHCFVETVLVAMRASPVKFPLFCCGRVHNDATKRCPHPVSDVQIRSILPPSYHTEYDRTVLVAALQQPLPMQVVLWTPCCKWPFEINRNDCRVVTRVLPCPYVCRATMCTGCERQLTLAEQHDIERRQLEQSEEETSKKSTRTEASNSGGDQRLISPLVDVPNEASPVHAYAPISSVVESYAGTMAAQRLTQGDWASPGRFGSSGLEAFVRDDSRNPMMINEYRVGEMERDVVLAHVRPFVSNRGGYRVREMERDVLLAHGIPGLHRYELWNHGLNNARLSIKQHTHDHLGPLCYRPELHDSVTMSVDTTVETDDASLSRLFRQALDASAPHCPVCLRFGLKSGSECNVISCRCGVEWCFMCSKQLYHSVGDYVHAQRTRPDRVAFMMERNNISGELVAVVGNNDALTMKPLSSTNHHGCFNTAPMAHRHDPLDPGKAGTLCPSTLEQLATTYDLDDFVEARAEYHNRIRDEVATSSSRSNGNIEDMVQDGLELRLLPAFLRLCAVRSLRVLQSQLAPDVFLRGLRLQADWARDVRLCDQLGVQPLDPFPEIAPCLGAPPSRVARARNPREGLVILNGVQQGDRVCFLSQRDHGTIASREDADISSRRVRYFRTFRRPDHMSRGFILPDWHPNLPEHVGMPIGPSRPITILCAGSQHISRDEELHQRMTHQRQVLDRCLKQVRAKDESVTSRQQLHTAMFGAAAPSNKSLRRKKPAGGRR